ncbi:hypothetical protein MLD38_024147 [Melastoma candidum]|uniref:Uncharacterized protein n=1 Tax=Melastoma candidum TaxID=119954 RepID=A0ACB9NWE3_9MYRT|nr:hypothetical protein MLD38_024147 [Melastoma candidum]
MSSSYWCYRCSRFVRVWSQDTVTCPNCDGGFVEEINTASAAATSPPPPLPAPSLGGDHRRRGRFPAAAMYMINSQNSSSGSSRRARRNAGDRSPFNPVIVLRRPSDGTGDAQEHNSYELYYDDGGGSGLRPLPPSISEFLLGSGFDRLLDQLSQIEINGISHLDRPPASKAAIESMPVVEIGVDHITSELHCAVCKEVFELGCDAREMPCKHIYHEDCILPWLALRNSCPVCRFEMPADGNVSSRDDSSGRGGENGRGTLEERVYDEEESGNTNDNNNTVGLTIWRLPGGGFAVGRFSNGQRNGERELPVVYTEMDGGFNNGGMPRRISWETRGTGRRDRGGLLRRVFRNLFGCFGGGRRTIGSSLSSAASSSSSPVADIRTGRSRLFHMGTSSSSRRHRALALVADDGSS